MKKILAILAILLLLAACAKTPAPVNEEKPVEIPVETVETSETQEPEPEQPEEIPVITEPETEAPPVDEPATAPTVAYYITLIEGLAGDAVGYALELPTFPDLPAADQINAYYVSLTDHLAAFSQDTVHTACLERNCIADVRGYAENIRLEGDTLTVTYTYQVQYSDQNEATLHSRTDQFNTQTGEVTELTE